MARLGIAGVVGVLGLGLLTPAAGSAAPAAAPPTGAYVVGTASPTCPKPTFTAIQPAVDAAPAGGTVYVCAGTYTGRVTITKTLRLLGAQSGRDARSGRTALAAESVVTSTAGGLVVNGTVNGLVVDGFTFRGSAGDGIDALGGGSGFSIVNNVFADNQNGMNVSAAGPAPSTIARNRFTANNRGADPQAGTGILFTSGPANDVTVSDNLFERHISAAVNSIGDPSKRSRGLVVRNNRSVDDSSLAVVNNTVGALIDQNQATKPATATGTIIYIVGNNDGLTVRRNVLTGGRGTGISANGLDGPFATPESTNLLIDTNVVRDRTTGIAINGAHRSVTVRGNVVQGSTRNGDAPGRGIVVSATSSGLVLTNNVATGSSDVDCVDASKGGRTAGTADTWTANVGRTATPPGICIPGRAPAASPVPTTG
ncbi:right-handed parallel beta-helix repeat-containing protein [Actinomycetospora atypica]|uniref:Nitrous oxide reductase family maturation protein NosD n=1 Tax=Actinomycetospora atypica TaxID=1290095 RepID=A0ABV9YVF3_9PSEU